MEKKLTQKEKEKLIKEIVGTALIPKGYVFEAVNKLGLWIFRKREGDVVKEISFHENMGRERISSYLETNFHFPSVDILSLVPDFEYEHVCGGIQYTNREEFKNALEMLLSFLEIHGFTKLEQLSEIKTDVRVTRKYSKYIWDNAKKISYEKRTEWGLEGKSYEEQLEILSNLIEQEKNKTFSAAEPQLADIAAVFGELMISYFGGKWEWNDYANNVMIDIRRAKKEYATGRPYSAVIDQWKGETTVYNEWERIKKSLERWEELRKNIKPPWEMFM